MLGRVLLTMLQLVTLLEERERERERVAGA